MSNEVQVSYYDLSRLNNAVSATLGAVNALQSQTDQVQNKVNYVGNKVETVNRDLQQLKADFLQFVKVQENRHNMDVALAKITHVRQEVEQKFGKHQDARTRLRGILDTADTGLLREHTIELCSEQIMLDTPKYWLSPCLVALAAWISNNEELARRALVAALSRDVEKTTLLFALICRKTIFPAACKKCGGAMSLAKDGIYKCSVCNNQCAVKDAEDNEISKARQAACLSWLEQYFKLQDPLQMKASVIVLVDAWTCNVFGQSKDGQIQAVFQDWMKDIEDDYNKKHSETTFEREQIGKWKAFFDSKCHSIKNDSRYNALVAVCPEFDAADAYIQRINAADTCQSYFEAILAVEIDTTEFIDRLDDQLENLITDFDIEESIIREEEQDYSLIEEYEGDLELASKVKWIQKIKSEDRRSSFVDRLNSAINSNDPKYRAARKTAVKQNFLGKYISAAYTEHITEKKADFPEQVTLKHKLFRGWSGSTTDGKNGSEIEASYKKHVDDLRQKDLAGVSNKAVKNAIILLAIFAVLGVIGFAAIHAVVGIISFALAAFMGYRWSKANSEIKQQKAAIDEAYEKMLSEGLIVIHEALRQWAELLKVKNDFEAKNEIVLKALVNW